MSSGASKSNGGAYRALQLVCTTAIGMALVGYFVGLGGGAPHRDTPALPPVSTGDAVPALSYAELRTQSWSPNRDFSSNLGQLVSTPLAEALRSDVTARLQSLADRATRRSYNGAPPVIPHPIDTTSATACLACHGAGLRVAERSASRIPHAAFQNCTQCHAEARTSVPGGAGPIVASTFVGLPAPLAGPRAAPGAPPQIPHTTWMRDQCLSCHGPTGMPGMLTTHPERQQCRQCHASNAALDQAILADGPLFLAPDETP